MVDFNANSMVDFCRQHLMKVLTSYKNPVNPSAIDLMLINAHRSFQNPCVADIELSYFQKILVTVIKTYFEK